MTQHCTKYLPHGQAAAVRAPLATSSGWRSRSPESVTNTGRRSTRPSLRRYWATAAIAPKSARMGHSSGDPRRRPAPAPQPTGTPSRLITVEGVAVGPAYGVGSALSPDPRTTPRLHEG